MVNLYALWAFVLSYTFFVGSGGWGYLIDLPICTKREDTYYKPYQLSVFMFDL